MTGPDLVTGGHGFLGGHLVAALRARGRRVRVLDLRGAPPGTPEDPGVERLQGSVTDPDAAARACAGVERVFHAAANPELWAREPGRFDRINRAGTETMVEAARAAGARRFVHTSSEVVLVARRGPRPARLDETLEFAPGALIGAYARSKRAAELAVLAAAAAGDLDALVAIPTVPMGPGDVSRTPPTRLLADVRAGRLPAVPSVWFDAVDVRDAAEGHVLAAERGRPGVRYLLSGHSLPMPELVRAAAEADGARPPRARIPGWLAEGFAALDTARADLTGRPPIAPWAGAAIARRMRPCGNARARAALGFTPRPVAETLQDAMAWLRARDG